SEVKDSSRLMGIVVREADRLGGLITNFLDYARPRPLKRDPIEMESLCEEVLEMLKSACPEAVSLELRCETSPSVEGDADQLKQVLWNLCLNGIEAMPSGGVLRLTVGNASQAAFGKGRNHGSGETPGVGLPGAEIVVADEGEGIDPEAAERLFEPFFTTKSSGTGLGLATVHRILEGHGGCIDVESKRDEGTRFRIWLPLCEANETNEIRGS
ncbi:MAG: ATP-binding protein, partial [Myxococcota bacterium]|nr:ATP-binding protein [Myxococcota bacterium]